MIKIICVGKIADENLKQLSNRYQKWISKFDKIEIIELRDDNINDERTRILKAIRDNEYVIALDISGKELSSEEFSKKIENLFIDGTSYITFVIGGSNGLHQDIKDRANCKWSFSRLTFPHQLFRVILLEQIYRGFKIIKNEPYHK